MRDWVKTVINEWDPVGLFPGAPEDEYDIEIDMVVSAITFEKDSKSLAKAIQRIFAKHFGKDVFDRPYEECIMAAKKILVHCQL